MREATFGTGGELLQLSALNVTNTTMSLQEEHGVPRVYKRTLGMALALHRPDLVVVAALRGRHATTAPRGLHVDQIWGSIQ